MKSFIAKVTLFLSLVVLCLSFKTVEAFAATGSTGNTGSMDAIQELFNQGFIDGSFSPDANVTRAELAKIVAGIFNQNRNVVSTPSGSSFSDFTENPGWYSPTLPFISGLIADPTDGIYSPGTNVNREELATIFVSALGFNATGLGGQLPFNDSDTISSWARDYVGYAVANGLMSGDPANNFNPQNPVTGQEVAQTTLNTIEHAEDLGIILAPVPVSEPESEPEPEQSESKEAKIKEAPDQIVIEDIVEGPNDGKIVLTDSGITIEDLLGAIVALDNSKQIYEFWRDGNKLQDIIIEIISGDKLLVTAENGVNKHTYSFELPNSPNNPNNQPVEQEQVQEQEQQQPQALTEQAPPTEDVVVPE